MADIDLIINCKEISTNLMNNIVHFSNQVQLIEKKEMRIICDNKPLLLKGKLRNLTHNAKKWFAYWNANDNMRNISEVRNENRRRNN